MPFGELFDWKGKSKIKSGDGSIVGKYKMFVCSDSETKRYDEFLENAESIVFGTGGKASCHYANEPFAYSTDCIVAQPKSDKIYVKFYYYYFRQNNLSEIQKTFTGSGLQHTSKKKIESISVPLPEASEQQRIVAKIEELFSKLDKGVEELNKIKEQLKIYRQAVLKEAFESYEKYDLYTLDNLMTLRNGYGKKPDDIGSFKILRISSVRPMKLNLQDYRVNRSKFDDNDIIAENDILFTRYNGSEDYVGVCAYVPKLSEAYAYPDKIIKGTPFIKNKSHSKFLQFYLNYGDARAFIRSKIKTTSGQKGIAGSDLKKVIIRLPDIQTQERCVSKIERELSVCDKIEQTVNETLQKAESLRQSILKQAFDGKLV